MTVSEWFLGWGCRVRSQGIRRERSTAMACLIIAALLTPRPQRGFYFIPVLDRLTSLSLVSMSLPGPTCGISSIRCSWSEMVGNPHVTYWIRVSCRKMWQSLLNADTMEKS